MKLNALKFVFMFCLSPFVLLACAEDEDETGGTPSVDLNIEIESSTDNRGRANVSFVTGDINKLSITAETDPSSNIKFTRVQGGSENYLTPNGESVSLSDEFFPNNISLSAPSRRVDPELSEGIRFDVGVEVNGDNRENQPVVFKINSRKDNNLNAGSLQLNLFYVGSVGAESSTKDAVLRAMNEARSIFSSAAGIQLQVSEMDIDGPVILPLPVNGDTLYERASNNAASPAVNIFIGGDIQGQSSSVVGVAAGIPGPAIPSRKSAVAVSIFASAGPNGRFSEEDIRVLGETIAHESGHQMGLFHPIDFSGSQVFASDPIDDTKECSFFTECVQDDSLVRNLMFPNILADIDEKLIPQNQLTPGQRAVMNRYIAVN